MKFHTVETHICKKTDTKAYELFKSLKGHSTIMMLNVEL